VTLCWAGGVLRPVTEFRPHLDDRAFRYGDGVFATLALRRGRLLDAEAHLERLNAACVMIGLAVPEAVGSPAGLLPVLERMGVAEHMDGVVRVQVSAAPGGRGYGRSGPAAWELVEVLPLPEPRILTVAVLDPEEAPVPSVPRVKSCSALAHVLCGEAARRRACGEAVRTTRGLVLEAAAANVFWADDAELFTPSASLPLYPGVTRSIVIESARQAGWTVHEGEFAPSDLRRSTAAFLTNAVRGIEPIARLDGADLDWPPRLEALRTAVESARMEAGLPVAGRATAPGAGP
jgi:branched-subunit amino acid aminotransferase/4-amino-4-deoxychorismate lyase